MSHKNLDYPNETMRLLLERASCRTYKPDSVPDETIDLVLKAGVSAPSAGNLQPFSIIKIREERARAKICEMMGQPFVGEAPVLLLFCLDFNRLERWAALESAPFTADSAFRHFWVGFQDVAICAQNICTAADALGMGTCYIGTASDHMPELCEMLNLPQKVCPVVILTLGYPSERLKLRKKFAPEVIIHDETYHDLSDGELVNAFNQKYNNEQFEITEERLQVFEETCKLAMGAEFAVEALAKVKENGTFNRAQFYFGLHYRAHRMPLGNEDFLKNMEEMGLDWFKPWRDQSGSAAMDD